MASATASEFHAATAPPPVRYERKFDLLSPEYEVLDPNPDLHVLFAEYNALFFDGKLAGCEVRWSSRMTLCAGLCSFQPRSGFCSIRLSEPLLKLRPRSDMINTLLHEMIHAYVFVFSRVKDHDDHGTVFQSHMHRINQTAGTYITVFHSFHDEVDSYRQHWWKCTGSCQRSPPYYGVVKRAMNRPPGPTDPWWKDHETKCGGTYEKIKDPPGFKEKQELKARKKLEAAEKRKKKEAAATPSVKSFFPVVRGDSEDNGDAPNDASQATKTPGKKQKGTKAPATPQKGKAKGDEEEKKPPKSKKPRIGKPAADSSSTTTSAANPPPPSVLVVPASGVPVQPDFSGRPVVFSMGDGEFYLAGDIHALFQPPQVSSNLISPSSFTTSASSSATNQIVDLTFSDEDDESETKARKPESKSAASREIGGHQSASSRAAAGSRSLPTTLTEIIEID